MILLQMLRHYERTILLVESSEKFRQKIVNGGPFQVVIHFLCDEAI